MTNLSLNKPAGVLVKTTCVDFPGLVAGSFFLKGCNLRCPYCYNTELVLNQNQSSASEVELASINELFNHLEKRQGILQGLVISGGEALLNPYTSVIIKKAKELNYKVKLDTNGTLPDQLEKLISDNELKPDFIAMDIKTSPQRYAYELCNKSSIYYGKKDFFEDTLKRSSDLISTYKTEQREFRTVLVPELVEKKDIENMAAFLPQNASWQFAQFLNKNCLNPAFNNIIPYSDTQINELISYAKSFIPGAQLR